MIDKSKHIFFLTDNPPLKDKGSGLSVLLYQFLQSIKNSNLITFCGYSRISIKDIIKDNEGSTIFVPDKYFSFVSAIRGVRFFSHYIASVCYLFSVIGLSFKIRQHKNAVIFTSVGANSSPLWKALLLMSLCKNAKHWIYIVDDLEAINKKFNKKFELFLIMRLLPKAIKKCDKLICISESLGDIYFKEFGKKSLVLGPHYAATSGLHDSKSDNNEFKFLYTGGLNFLYNDSLLSFAKTIDKLNTVSSRKLSLKVQTYSPLHVFEALDFPLSAVTYSSVENRSELKSIYSECDCFLIPYSFDEQDSQMVKTSFPQKLAEIIQYGKPILVYGPKYGSVVEFFIKENLDYACLNQSSDDLKAVIEKIISFGIDKEKYRRSYEENFSAAAVRKIFNSLSNKH